MKGKGTLLLKDKAKLVLKENNSSNIMNEGSGDITIDGATITSSANNSTGIYDLKSKSDIYVKEGQVSGTTAIRKKNEGKIEIGELSDTVILGEASLYIHGSTYCLDVCRKTDVYFYNGQLVNDFRGIRLCCESTGTNYVTEEHNFKAGNPKWDIVADSSGIHKAYYVEDNSVDDAYDVAKNGDKVQKTVSNSLENKVLDLATMLALDILNK